MGPEASSRFHGPVSRRSGSCRARRKRRAELSRRRRTRSSTMPDLTCSMRSSPRSRAPSASSATIPFRLRTSCKACPCSTPLSAPRRPTASRRSSGMHKRRLGTSTLEVSVVGLGANNFGGRIDFNASARVVHKALDLGVNFIDTADTYGNRGGSEEALGRILAAKRKDIVLASKFGLPMNDSETLSGGSRRYIMSAVEASLKRLKTDYLDLYQLHRPDALTPIE